MQTFTKTPLHGLFLLLALSCLLISANAQHYDLGASSGTFTPVSGGTIVSAVEVDDAISGNLPIGFTFNYFGNNFTQLKASSNGFITFDLTNTDDPGNSIANNFDTDIVAPLWDDLDGIAGTASYVTTGSTPNRVFTFEWLNWQWNFSAPVGISFQVKLYETTNKIEFVYRQESGSVVSANASIGMIGPQSSKYYSLANTTATPNIDPNGNDVINTRPATGQVYSFTPGAAPVVPNTQASNISITPASYSLSLSWTSGNGAYRAVFMKANAGASETVSVSDGTFYSASSVFGNTASVGSGWYCVYNGTGNSVMVTNLESGYDYRVQVIEYNGVAGTQKYLTTTVTNNPADGSTVLVAPTTPVSTISLLRVSATEITLDLSEGNGTKRAIFMKAGTTGTAPVVNNSTYTANTTFGSGPQIGSSTSGWYCIFNGASSFDFTVTGLTGNTQYLIHAVDYNGKAGSEKYNVASVTNNPVSFTTFSNIPVPTYTFAASAGTFTPITGGTAVNDIEYDDELSTIIPLGFTFRLAGVPFTQVVASSNGFLSLNPFVDNLTSSSFNDLESSLNRPIIAPLWDDLDGFGGQASYVTTGSSPNRVFTFEWLNYQWDYSASAAGISFQVKLYESNNQIEFIYRQEAGTLSSADASIGLAFPNFNTGNYLSLDGSGASPSVSSSLETATISAKPATGQVYSFTPVKFNQTITFGSIAARNFGDATQTNFTLSATSTSGLQVSYQSSNTAVATVSGNTVTITGAGTTTITASQDGDANYNAATSVPQTLTVNKGNQNIIFSQPTAKTFGDAAFNLSATSSSGLAVSYSSSNTAVATVSGSTVTVVGAGTTDITASQAGNSNYNAATNVIRTLTVNKSNQTITFAVLPSKTAGDPTFDLTATSSSGLPISYSSSNTGVATISGNTVTILNAGTTDISASQAGNANYNAAPTVIQALTVKATQTITFNALSTKTFGDAQFNLGASATSGLAISYSSSNTSVATISNNTVTIVGAGSADITAAQTGDASFAAATSITRTLTVNKADQTITFTAPTAKKLGDPAVTLNGTSSSGLTVSYSTSGDKVTIIGDQATLAKAGSAIVRAEQAGNVNYNAATAVDVTFCINPVKPAVSASGLDTEAPVLTSSSTTGNQWYKDGAIISGETNTTFTVSSAGLYTVVVSADNCSSEPSEAQALVITGLENYDSGVTVYPNPVENEFVVDVTALQSPLPVSLKLVDVSGRTLNSTSGIGKIRLKVGAYKPGNYVLQIQSGKRIITKQIIKK